MKFFPNRRTLSQRLLRSLVFGVMLAVGILLGGGLAYWIGSGITAGADYTTPVVDPGEGGFLEEMDAVEMAAMPRLDETTRLSVAARRDIARMPEKGRVAIIIDDIGLNRRAFDQLVLMNKPLTFSILPYAPEAQFYADLARRAGHDVMLHLPMAPDGLDRADSAGPDTLRVADGPDQLRRKLRENLGKFEGYSGVNNHMGSGLTAEAGDMEVVLAALAEREVFFLDSVTTGETAVNRAADRLGQRYLHRDVFLDSDYSEVTEESVAGQLKLLEALARQRGYAIGIGHPYASTIAALDDWMDEADERGIEIVTISALIDGLDGRETPDLPEPLAQLR